ncbi:Hypothetical protein CINCED_3A004403 [Cinara cedri]|uniref:Uncharacterized protein n=1 Tax=Cinara cedri TaxID=506608 RepID=A0A5E4NQM2_9HEMI|nr:Hypothetical protein CINCED_3A004403 [Cinara cedri]
MSSDRNDQDDDMDTSSFSNIDVESISEDKTLDNIQDKVNLCLCNNHIEVILCDEGIVSCKAEDCVDGLLIKCKKLSFHIDDYGNMPMVRANVTLPFGSFCAFHMKRFFLHHSCPRCGRFCSEGIFMMCKNKHFSHIGCHQKEKGCLHCGVLDVYDVELKRRIVKPKKERCSTPSDIIVEIGNIKLSTICCPPQIDKAELSTYLQQLKDEISDSKRIMYSVSGLYQACESNNIPKVLSIIGSECNLMYRFTKISNRTALHAACANGNLMIIYLLLQAGVDPNVVDDKMKSPMRLAAKSGHSYAVQYLLEFNGAPEIKDLQGMTALHLAAKNGHFECCKVLSNKRPSMVNWKDKGGWTPLVWACENSHTEVVEHFITHKPNTRLPDEEHNVALHWAAISGCFDVVKCLVEYDPEVNMANDAGDTPLHIAARKNTFDIVSFLLENGAEASHKNKKNRQPIDCCFPNSKCYNLLKSYQQKISDKQSITPVNLQYTEPKLKIAQLPIVFKTTSVIVSEDISYGCEDVPIRCVNEIDDEQPVDFTYIKENCYDVGNHVDSAMSHIACCNCEGPCNTSNCKCVQTNGECLYDENGRLNSNFDYFNPSGIIYECNLRCRCHKQKCGNRVIQKGIKISLELFKHTDMGWGVRTRQAIPQGTFVCEYIGEIITDQKANDLKEDSYLFNLENPGADQLYCIDAYNYSNVSRFINHSCDPNLLSVRSFINHHDKRFPRIAFFATQNIAPNEQLYYDYGAAFWKIKGELFTCKCGKPNCSFSLETIQCLRIDSDDDNDDVNNDDYNDDNDVNDDYNDDYNDDNDVNDDYNDDNDVNDDYNDGDNGNDDDNDNKEEEETPIQIQSNKPKDKPSTVTLSNQNMLKKNEIICTKSLHEYTKMSSINSSVTTKYNTQKNNNSKNPNVISMPNNGLRAKNNDEDKHSKPLLGSHSTLNSKLIQDKLQNVIVNRKRIDQRILNRNVNASVRKKMLINNSKLSKSVEITDNKVLDSCLLRPKVLNSKKKIKLNNSTFQNDTILKTDDIKNNRKIISLDVSNRDQDTIEVLNDSNQMIDLINNELTDEESETELNMGNKESVDIPKNSYTSKGEYGKVLGIKTNFEKEHFLNNKNGHQLNRSMTFFERNNININSH